MSLSKALTPEEIALPVGFSSTGQMLNVHEWCEAKSKDDSLPSFSAYPYSDRRRLILSRLKQKTPETIFTLGGDTINREDAIREVTDGTELGGLIEELERREIAITVQRYQEI